LTNSLFYVIINIEKQKGSNKMKVQTNQVTYKLSTKEKEAIAVVRNMIRTIGKTELQQGNVASMLSKKVAFVMEALQEFTHDDRILF
jgi:hypothetical protein